MTAHSRWQLSLFGMLIAASASAAAPSFGHVEKSGSGKPVLILVPCLGCDWQSWDEFMERNKDDYTMYAVTWPGMGDTPMPDVPADAAGLPFHDYLDQAMTALIKREGLDKPTIIGHSAAGPSVVRFAYRYPTLAGKVISVDAVITNWDTFGYTAEQRDAWAKQEMSDVYDQYDSDDAWAKLNTARPRSYGDRKDRAEFYTRMWRKPPRENVLRYWREWLRNDVGAVIHEIRLPVLSIYAVSPRAKDPHEKMKKTRARFERAKVGDNVSVMFVQDAPHTIWEGQPAAFDKLIADFVNR